jgi:hypothetical protein
LLRTEVSIYILINICFVVYKCMYILRKTIVNFGSLDCDQPFLFQNTLLLCSRCMLLILDVPSDGMLKPFHHSTLHLSLWHNTLSNLLAIIFWVVYGSHYVMFLPPKCKQFFKCLQSVWHKWLTCKVAAK